MSDKTCVQMLSCGRYRVCLTAAAMILAVAAGLFFWLSARRSDTVCVRFPEAAAAAEKYADAYRGASSFESRLEAAQAALRLAEVFDFILRSGYHPAGPEWGFTAERFPLARTQADNLLRYDINNTEMTDTHAYLMWAADRAASGGWC